MTCRLKKEKRFDKCSISCLLKIVKRKPKVFGVTHSLQMETVPISILGEILSLVPTRYLFACLQICKKWKDIICKSSRFRHLEINTLDRFPFDNLELLHPIYPEENSDWEIAKARLNKRKKIFVPYSITGTVFALAFRKVVKCSSKTALVWINGDFNMEKELQKEYDDDLCRDVFVDRRGWRQTWVPEQHTPLNYDTLLVLEELIPLQHKRGFKAFYAAIGEYSFQNCLEQDIHVIVQIKNTN